MMQKFVNIVGPKHTFEKLIRELVSGLDEGTIRLSEDVKQSG